MTKFLEKRMFFGPPKSECEKFLNCLGKPCDHKGYAHVLKGKKWFCYACGSECESPNS